MRARSPRALARLARDAKPDGFADAARAIMTTDTYPKLATRKAEIDGVEVTINGIAKGAGMIAPDMATMLAFLFTDAAIEPQVLRASLDPAVDETLQRHHHRRRHLDQRHAADLRHRAVRHARRPAHRARRRSPARRASASRCTR